MMVDQALVSNLLGQRVEVQPRPGWNLPLDEAKATGGYSYDERQRDNAPIVGTVRSIAAMADGFMFHIEADNGLLVVKTSVASHIRVLR